MKRSGEHRTARLQRFWHKHFSSKAKAKKRVRRRLEREGRRNAREM